MGWKEEEFGASEQATAKREREVKEQKERVRIQKAQEACRRKSGVDWSITRYRACNWLWKEEGRTVEQCKATAIRNGYTGFIRYSEAYYDYSYGEAYPRPCWYCTDRSSLADRNEDLYSMWGAPECANVLWR